MRRLRGGATVAMAVLALALACARTADASRSLQMTCGSVTIESTCNATITSSGQCEWVGGVCETGDTQLPEGIFGITSVGPVGEDNAPAPAPEGGDGAQDPASEETEDDDVVGDDGGDEEPQDVDDEDDSHSAGASLTLSRSALAVAFLLAACLAAA